VRASEREVDRTKLCVVDNQLRLGSAPTLADSQPFEGFDHMLLRIEAFQKRDDWASLTAIDEPFREARHALKDQHTELAEFYLRMALSRAAEAPELTVADRRRVVGALKEQYAQAREDFETLGLVDSGEVTLASAMSQAMSIDVALGLGPVDQAEIFRSL
jgi:hypothetical protein